MSVPVLLTAPEKSFPSGRLWFLLSDWMTVSWVAAMVLIAMCSALPTLVTVIYVERKAMRSAGLYAAGGAVTGLVSIGILQLVAYVRTGSFGAGLTTGLAPVRQVVEFVWFLAVLAMAGAVAGLVYWAIAGRAAGPTPYQEELPC